MRFHPAVLVQAGHKGLRSVVGVRDLIGIEGHGTLEDVGFACLAVDVTLQRQNLRPPRVHLDQVEVAFVIEPSEAFGEIVVKPVEHLRRAGFAVSVSARCYKGGNRHRESRYTWRLSSVVQA